MDEGSCKQGVSRRGFAKGVGLGSMGLAVGVTVTPGGGGAEAGKSEYLNVTEFGAAGDGKADDTKAIQTALDKAGEIKGFVFVPPGTYMCSTLAMRPLTALVASPAWSYREQGGAVLKLADEKAKALVDITDAQGSTIEGLSLDGQHLGDDACGILLDKGGYGQHEDAFRIERCQVKNFSGDGVRLTRVWCYSVRHCMIAHNRGSGISQMGWDAFILDNWLSGNGMAGFGAYTQDTAAITMVGNRVEWDQGGGIVLYGASNANINDNYIDRCGGAGISILNEGRGPNSGISITGNHVNRSGKWSKPDTYESVHVRMDDCHGVAVVGNSFAVGRDDQGQGEYSPSYGIIFSKLSHCVIEANVFYNGAVKEIVRDFGGNGEEVVVKDNPGCLFRVQAKAT